MKRSIPCFIVEARGKCFGPFASEEDAKTFVLREVIQGADVYEGTLRPSKHADHLTDAEVMAESKIKLESLQ